MYLLRFLILFLVSISFFTACETIDTEKNETGVPALFQVPMKKNSYVVTSKFGQRKNPVTKKIKLHKGIDLAGKIGTPIYATAPGIVIFADIKNDGYGKCVLLKHPNGVVSRYAHLHKILVKKGQPIKGGAPIGTLGKTGRVSGPHLHFEILRAMKPVNPESVLKF